MQEEHKSKMSCNLQNLIIIKFFLILAFFLIISGSLVADNHSNFKQVEATGRAILIEGDINTSRKRALEDALYIAALRGGANVDGFSAISSNTVINDHSIVKATNKVIDFKILSEEQNKEFLSIKISAVVGNELVNKNCKKRPLNITLLKGSYDAHSNVPSKLARYTPIWFKKIYEIIPKIPNIKTSNKHDKSLEGLKKSNLNSSFNYSALTKGLPNIQAGDYSLVPSLYLAAMSGSDSFSNYRIRLGLNIYKGPDFKLVSKKNYNLSIKYKFDSKFQFFKNISTLDINYVDKEVSQYLLENISSFLLELNCQPLEGVLALNEGKLIVDLGKKQGLRQKQIGIVKGLNIENSMLSNSSVIVHTREVYDNYSVLLPLNENLKLANLDNMIVEFVE
jgi:hypothetical protein